MDESLNEEPLDAAQAQSPLPEAEGEQESPAPLCLDDLPLPLRFDLGGLDVTLGELAEIGPGHVFTLAAPSDEPVRIMLSGRCVGKGALVSVGDRIGVRITELYLEKSDGPNATV